jgi:hypothetical protein
MKTLVSQLTFHRSNITHFHALFFIFILTLIIIIIIIIIIVTALMTSTALTLCPALPCPSYVLPIQPL